MRLPILTVLALCSSSMAAQERPCLPLQSDRILGRDMARAVPEFAALSPDAVLAVSPVAGSTRVFQAAEIAYLAARYGVPVASPQTVCFGWEMRRLDRNKVLDAMRASLKVPQAQIAIVEMMSDPAPAGLIAFPRENLGKPASPERRSPVLWRGGITYGGSRYFAIWARVEITAPVNVYTAAETLKQGQPIRAGTIKAETKEGFPEMPVATTGLNDLIGMLPLRTIAAGAEVRLDNLVRPNEVNRGDLVAIEVRSGNARLMLSGRAESAGRTGDMIAVRNPDSNRVFKARVSAKDKAVVDTVYEGN